MAIVSVAMTLSFHLKHQPTALERQIAKPLGAIFWLLAVLILAVGISNYIRTFCRNICEHVAGILTSFATHRNRQLV